MADVAIEPRYQFESRDIEYRRESGEPLLARLYRPVGPGPFPALVEVHGGAWASGDRLNNAPIHEALAKSGIVVLALDFRMPPQHRYPASIADINYATRWLKAHANEFGSRRELVGGIATSSGAHQLLLSLLKPRDPRYAELPLAEAAGEDASLPYHCAVLADFGPARSLSHGQGQGERPACRGARRLLGSEAEMEEGNPQLILERGEAAASLPPAILIQGPATTM